MITKTGTETDTKMITNRGPKTITKTVAKSPDGAGHKNGHKNWLTKKTSFTRCVLLNFSCPRFCGCFCVSVFYDVFGKFFRPARCHVFYVVTGPGPLRWPCPASLRKPGQLATPLPRGPSRIETADWQALHRWFFVLRPHADCQRPSPIGAKPRNCATRFVAAGEVKPLADPLAPLATLAPLDRVGQVGQVGQDEIAPPFATYDMV